jgi:ribonuclease HII
VLAKVERDSIMVALAREHSGYSWELNKGYCAPEHTEALRRLGPCAQHRKTWSLPPFGHLTGPVMAPTAAG